MPRNFLGVIKGVNRITCRFTPLFAEREGNDHSATTPCIIVFYSFILLNCSHIVATTEYFESTRRYCYPKCALAFLGFKSTKK